MSRPKIERLEDWTYKVEGLPGPVPSVTNIIKATVPKELAWWGMQVGVEGTLQLMAENKLWKGASPEVVIGLLSANSLTVNDTLKRAGTRGTEVHDILEAYGKTGTLPEVVSASAAGYAKALGLWLLENQPEFYEQEVMTASLEHEYAGTFDGKATFQAGRFQGQNALIDIKTSKRIYKDQHFPQLEAYEYAEQELGEDPVDACIVVRLAESGKYQMSVSTDTFDDFYVLLQHYRSIQDRKNRNRK